WLYDGRVHERRESRYDSGVRGHRLQWSSRSEVVRTEGLLSGGLLLIPCLLTYTSNYLGPVRIQKAARNRDRTARTDLNEVVLNMVETTPSLSTRGIANEIGISYSSVGGFSMIVPASISLPARPVTKKNVTLHLVGPFHRGTCSNELQIPFLQPPCCSQMRRLFSRGVFSTPITATRGQRRTHM
ncbi:hypothetical protein TNCV_4067421, partial [Trichonephila clavipes]